ncbi:MAG: hypothetical protein LBK07_11415, partial [Tannerella sp.]|nr:hypothetical protein [Tannerella sp.]
MKKKIFILVCLGFLLSGMALTVKAQSNISVYIDDYLRGQGWPVASGEDGSSARVEGPWGVVYNGFDYDYNEGYFRWYIYSSCTYNLVIQQSAGKSLADSVIYVRLIPAVKGKPNDRDTVTNYTTLPYSFKITQAQVDAAKDAGLGNGVVLIPFSIGDMPAKYDSLTLLYKVNPPDGGGYLSSYTVGWNWNFFNTAKVAVDYIAPGPVNYTGKADLSITGGAPNMVRSLNGGITWTPVYDGDNNIIPLTPTEISNLGSIYFKSPNSCSYQSFSLGGGGGALPGGLPRAVT